MRTEESSEDSHRGCRGDMMCRCRLFQTHNSSSDKESLFLLITAWLSVPDLSIFIIQLLAVRKSATDSTPYKLHINSYYPILFNC